MASKQESSRHVYQLDVDKRKLDKKLKETQKAFNETGEQGSKAFGTKLVAGFAAASAALAGLVAGMAKLIGLASEAEETSAKFGTVYADAIGDADKATLNLTKNFGLSNLEAQKLLSSTGDLLTGFGFTGGEALNLSSNVQQLAVDLASFTNAQGGAEAVSNALTKALLGEREGLKTYGIAIREADVQQQLLAKGQSKLTGLALQQAKAYITLEIATRQSKNAVGDFARTSDSFANQQRILAAVITDLSVKLGQKLLPAATAVVGAIKGLVKTFDDLIGDDIPSEMEKLSDSAVTQKIAFDTLASTYDYLALKVELTAGEQELYNETVFDLQEMYPNYLKNIDFEKDGYDNITKALKEAGAQLDLYLQKKVQQSILAEQEEQFIELGKKIVAAQKEQAQQQVRINQLQNSYQNNLNESLNLTDEQAQQLAEFEKLGVGVASTLETAWKEEQEALKLNIAETQAIIAEIFAIAPAVSTIPAEITKEWIKVKDVLEDTMMTELELSELQETLFEADLERVEALQAAHKAAGKARYDEGKATADALRQQGQLLENISKGIGEAIVGGLVDTENFKDALKNILVIMLSFIQKQVMAGYIAAGTKAIFGDFSGLAQIAGITALFEALKVSVASFAVGVENFQGGMAKVHKDEVINLPAGSTVLNRREVSNAVRASSDGSSVETNELLKELIGVMSTRKTVIKKGDIYESYNSVKKNVL